MAVCKTEFTLDFLIRLHCLLKVRENNLIDITNQMKLITIVSPTLLKPLIVTINKYTVLVGTVL